MFWGKEIIKVQKKNYNKISKKIVRCFYPTYQQAE